MTDWMGNPLGAVAYAVLAFFSLLGGLSGSW